jgi:hypothetical protein
MEKLQEEKKKQHEHVEKVMARLKQVLAWCIITICLNIWSYCCHRRFLKHDLCPFEMLCSLLTGMLWIHVISKTTECTNQLHAAESFWRSWQVLS